MLSEYDFLVIGAGMAGTSIAAHLSATATVCLLEMERHPGQHSTGRSAALFAESYGNAPIRALTRASRAFLETPPFGFCNQPLVKPRGVLIVAGPGQERGLKAFVDSVLPGDDFERMSVDAALGLCPILREDGLVDVLYSRRPVDIDVNELQQGYLRLFRERRGVLTVDAQVLEITHRDANWLVSTATQTLRAKNVVNAAGAWAGDIARLADAQDIGLTPLRRTAFLVAPPPGQSIHSWPMLMDVEEQFYLKPDAGQLLISPADETPSPPCDAQPDEWDIATAVDRVERATTLKIDRITRKWAGLRSFVADRSPVVGYDSLRPGFFWLAALGGYGIQTAPGLSRVAAALALGNAPDAELLQFGVELEALSPQRFNAPHPRTS